MPRLQARLGQISGPMLRNHGLPTFGRSSAEAFVYMYFFEYSCRIQKEAHGGGELNLIGPGSIAANIGKAATAGQVPVVKRDRTSARCARPSARQGAANGSLRRRA